VRLIKRLQFRAALSAAVLAAVPLSLAAAPVGAQLPAPTFSLHFNAKVSGAPAIYHLEMYANQTGIPANMQMWLRRHASTGNHVEQSHEYDVNETQTACTNSLGNCHRVLSRLFRHDQGNRWFTVKPRFRSCLFRSVLGITNVAELDGIGASGADDEVVKIFRPDYAAHRSDG